MMILLPIKKLQSLKLNKDEKQLIELYDIVLREAKKLRNIILPSNMEFIKLKTNKILFIKIQMIIRYIIILNKIVIYKH